MGTETKTVPKDILAAFAVLGLAWLDRLPTVGDAMHMAVDPFLVLGDDGVWRPEDPEVAACYPAGLTLTEALGLTLIAMWSDDSEPPPLIASQGHLRFYIPDDEYQNMTCSPEKAIGLATAWLTVRRAMRPPVPWGPRDPVAEELQRVIRAASARLSPARVERLRPEVNASDIGRDWGRRYYQGEF